MGFRKATLPAADESVAFERTVDELASMLDHADADALRRAALDLGLQRAAARHLVSRLANEADTAVREAILTSLTQIGDVVSVDGLVACLRSEDAALRNEAIDVMKTVPDLVAPMMDGLLADADPDLRILAINLLESLRHPKVEEWLLEVIRKDAHLNVCATATDLLSEVGTEAAVEPLAALKKRFPDEPYIVFAADIALKRLAPGADRRPR
jgi:HEAT repeat protein